jgi:hypothetical protein
MPAIATTADAAGPKNRDSAKRADAKFDGPDRLPAITKLISIDFPAGRGSKGEAAFYAATGIHCEHRRSNPAIDVLDCHDRPSCLP